MKNLITLFTVFIWIYSTNAQFESDQTKYGKILSSTGTILKETILNEKSISLTSAQSGLEKITLPSLLLEDGNSNYRCVTIEVNNHPYTEFVRLDWAEIKQLSRFIDLNIVANKERYSFISRFYGRLEVKFDHNVQQIQIGLSNPSNQRYRKRFSGAASKTLLSEINSIP